jgi:hypothetical protein
MTTRIEVNCETGEVKEIPLTPEEIAQREVEAAAAEAQRQAEEDAKAEKAAARLAILEKLGLTEEEAALLLN